MEDSRKVPWIQTPLIRSTPLSEAAGCNVFLKLENLQPSGSFKSRGIGYYILSKLRELQAANDNESKPVTAHFYSSSGGNAGLACVHAAITLNCQASVVVPQTTSDFMIAKLRQAGATDVIQEGASWQEADNYLTETVMAAARDRGEVAVYVPPFDNPDVWQGNSGISREIAWQLGETARHYPVSLDAKALSENGSKSINTDGGHQVNGNRQTVHPNAIVCSVGGGGLFSGIAQGVDELEMRNTRIIAVETQGADSLAQAVAKGELVTLPAITSLATSLGARRVCSKALEYALRDNVSTVVLPDSEAIMACHRFADEERFLVELACGVCPALCYNGKLAELVPNFNKDSVVVIVLCGGSHISFAILEKYMSTLTSGRK
ncbi:hypothetical protein HIM_02842 [Hirsutella minnesotensis 3608]|nr:hypothetical protein HIM_02842 [Hirsutella minnesotensis 3608]